MVPIFGRSGKEIGQERETNRDIKEKWGANPRKQRTTKSRGNRLQVKGVITKVEGWRVTDRSTNEWATVSVRAGKKTLEGNRGDENRGKGGSRGHEVNFAAHQGGEESNTKSETESAGSCSI